MFVGVEDSFEITDVGNLFDDVFLNLKTFDEILTEVLPFMIFCLDIVDDDFFDLN